MTEPRYYLTKRSNGVTCPQIMVQFLFLTPVQPEILPQVKDEILHKPNLTPLSGYHSNAAILAYSPSPVGEVHGPVCCNDVVSC